MSHLLRSCPSLGSRFVAQDQHSSCLPALPRRLATGNPATRNPPCPARNISTATAATAASATTNAIPVAAIAIATIATAASSGSSVLGLSAAGLFGASSALMVPVYCLMSFFRTAHTTRFGVLHSPILYITLAVLHVAALAAAWPMGLSAALGAASQAGCNAVGALLGGLAAGGSSGVAAAVGAGTEALGALSGMFSGAPVTTLTAWLHLICLDVLMAREVALDGLTAGVVTWHSVLLCFFFGPLGILSHAVTKGLTGR